MAQVRDLRSPRSAALTLPASHFDPVIPRPELYRLSQLSSDALKLGVLEHFGAVDLEALAGLDIGFVDGLLEESQELGSQARRG